MRSELLCHDDTRMRCRPAGAVPSARRAAYPDDPGPRAQSRARARLGTNASIGFVCDLRRIVEVTMKTTIRRAIADALFRVVNRGAATLEPPRKGRYGQPSGMIKLR